KGVDSGTVSPPRAVGRVPERYGHASQGPARPPRRPSRSTRPRGRFLAPPSRPAFGRVKAMHPFRMEMGSTPHRRSLWPTLRDSGDPLTGDQSSPPRRVIQPTDLHARTVLGGRVDDLSLADVEGGVIDLLGRGTEEEQVPGNHVLPIDLFGAFPLRLQASVPRHRDPPAAHEHLRKAGAVVPVA